MRNRLMAGLALLALSVLVSCSTTGPSEPETDSGPIDTRSISGTVSLPDGAPQDPSDLTLVSFAGQAEVQVDGGFSLVVPDTELPQVVLVLGSGASPVLLGYVTSEETDVVVDASSTALSLVLLNPFTTMFSAYDRSALVTVIESKDWWPELVVWTEEALGRSGTGRIDERVEPALLQLASEITVDVLNDWPAGGLAMNGPWFVDAPGGAIDAVNPGPAYCVATFRSNTGDSTSVLLDSARENVRIHPAWPPFVGATSRTTTRVDLGDGTFSVSFTTGDFSSLDVATANGRAGRWNAARAVTELLALGTGVTETPDPAALDLGSSELAESAARVRASDNVGFIRALLDLVEQESDQISEWFWQEEIPEAELYVETLCPLLSGIAFSTSVIAPEETRVPLHSWLASGTAPGSQSIFQEDGVLSEAGTNAPPRAAFSIAPDGAQPGELVTFDASGSNDPDSPSGELEYRWDWQNDGGWDTAWSGVDVIGHAFATAGPHEVALEVRDRTGLSSRVVHVVNVGGGEDSATHVVVLRDAIPWGNEVPDVLDTMLEMLGFTEGPGPGEYEVLDSSAIDTLLLSPGTDLVIVQSDQPQRFYDAYAENQVRFLRFVEEGGTIFWEACDQGSHGGSIGGAGIVLPGAVDLVPYETWYNYVAMPGAPIVEGLPTLLYGQYASHSGIEDLPDGAVTYVTDDAGRATLVEFSYGGGWVILTTQPLEWSFYNNWTSGAVMPHVVSYVLGLPLVYDFGDIVKPEERGAPRKDYGAGHLTSGAH
ncbi:MAG: hypothetical protein GF400_00185 [Candidatus Eisenbacteria bacterium]|nr:hypothetical protein [Candidatus Eisenbacteria bacterium]